MVKKVTLYSTPGCTPCEWVREFFNKEGIPFTEVDIIQGENLESMKKITDKMVVPITDIDGDVVVGANIKKIREILGR